MLCFVRNEGTKVADYYKRRRRVFSILFQMKMAWDLCIKDTSTGRCQEQEAKKESGRPHLICYAMLMSVRNVFWFISKISGKILFLRVRSRKIEGYRLSTYLTIFLAVNRRQILLSKGPGIVY